MIVTIRRLNENGSQNFIEMEFKDVIDQLLLHVSSVDKGGSLDYGDQGHIDSLYDLLYNIKLKL